MASSNTFHQDIDAMKNEYHILSSSFDEKCDTVEKLQRQIKQELETFQGLVNDESGRSKGDPNSLQKFCDIFLTKTTVIIEELLEKNSMNVMALRDEFCKFEEGSIFDNVGKRVVRNIRNVEAIISDEENSGRCEWLTISLCFSSLKAFITARKRTFGDG
ncbi:hypothetical protein ACFE04_015152 [Oxalis oulophora]